MITRRVLAALAALPIAPRALAAPGAGPGDDEVRGILNGRITAGHGVGFAVGLVTSAFGPELERPLPGRNPISAIDLREHPQARRRRSGSADR